MISHVRSGPIKLVYSIISFGGVVTRIKFITD